MKKLIALLLIGVLCLSLVACGDGAEEATAPKSILGAWKDAKSYDILVFSADGKITRGDETLDWWYDEGAERYGLSYYGLTYTFVIETDENGRFFAIEGVHYYYVENYNAEAMEAEKIASITEGKTELVVGNSYTSQNGIAFTFDRAEITGEDTDCMFNLYLIHEGSLDMGQADYESFTHWSRFGGLAHQPNGSEGTTHRYAGGFEEMADLQKDREEYGFLCFTIDGAEYYVSIKAFFA